MSPSHPRVTEVFPANRGLPTVLPAFDRTQGEQVPSSPLDRVQPAYPLVFSRNSRTQDQLEDELPEDEAGARRRRRRKGPPTGGGEVDWGEVELPPSTFEKDVIEGIALRYVHTNSATGSGAPSLQLVGNTDAFPDATFYLLGILDANEIGVSGVSFSTGAGSITQIAHASSFKFYRVEVSSSGVFVINIALNAQYTVGATLFAVHNANTIVQTGTPTLLAFASNNNAGFQIYAAQVAFPSPPAGAWSQDYGVTASSIGLGDGGIINQSDFYGTTLVPPSTSGEQTSPAFFDGLAVEIGP